MARTNSKSSLLMTSFFVVQANTDSREKTMRSDLAVNTGQIEIFWHLSHLEPQAYFLIHRGHWISFQSALLIQILPASNLELHSRIYNSFSHASKPTHVTGGLPFNCSWSTGGCWRIWLQGVQLFFHCSLMVSYEGLADEYLWVPHSKCCFKPEKVQNILIHPVSVHGKTAADERCHCWFCKRCINLLCSCLILACLMLIVNLPFSYCWSCKVRECNNISEFQWERAHACQFFFW